MNRTAEPPAAYQLEVVPGSGAHGALLEVALDGRGFPHGPGLDFLGGDFDHENWSGDPEQIGVFSLSEPDRADTDAAPAARRLYSRLIDRLARSPYGFPLRLWNYFPAINAGEGDRERYRRFCVGRGEALREAGLSDARMCAATAIGGDQQHMQVVALVGARAGMSIENPRQVSAWNYPRQYGPRQPAFARATAVDLDGGHTGLLVSGTASVIGHVTAHPHDVEAQTEEAASNLEALLAHAAGALNRPGLARFNAHSLARVYVRDARDWPKVQRRLRRRWPGLRMCGLRGDICRDDLMMEIEAWHRD